MDDEFELADEDWSAWKVWCHPVSARDVIDELNIRIMSLDKNHKDSMSALEEQKALCERLSEENESLHARLDEREKQLVDVRNDLAGVKSELSEAKEELTLCKSVDEQLAELMTELEKVEEMKRRYEKRIKTLEGLLLQERTRKKEPDPDMTGLEDMESDAGITHMPTIDMSVNARVDISEMNGKPQDRKPGKKAEELQRNYKEKRAFGLPEKFPDSSDSDEWLMGLPDV